MTADVDRAALADMLVRCGIERGVLGRIDADNVARILLPVVDAIARRRAAEELRAAADDIDDWGANAERYRAIVTPDSIEHATATARLVAYERSRNILRRQAHALTDHEEAGPQPGPPSGTLTG